MQCFYTELKGALGTMFQKCESLVTFQELAGKRETFQKRENVEIRKPEM